MFYRIIALLVLGFGLILSCDEEKPINPVVPQSPNLLTSIQVTFNTITLNWNDRSNNEEGFELEMGDGTEWHSHTTVNADVTEILVDGLVPSTQYSFRVFAFNQAGRSEPSNVYTVSTQSNNPPPAPTGVVANPLAPTVVKVEWNDTAPMSVNFAIDRRTPSASWTRVGQVGDNEETFNDSTCTASTTYYYRVGTMLGNLLTWSVDSAETTTPSPGTPLPPSNLTTTIIIGTGVRLNWTDHSLDETEFQIRRNRDGQFFEIIDTIAANSVEYVDTLGDDVGIYNYQVRAANSFGVSPWSNPALAEYDYCSDGAVPICLENFWTYEVDPPTGQNYNARRQIRRVDYPGGVDYYLMVEFIGDETDTLFYWRNFDNGLYQDEYPLDGTDAELLLRTPPSAGFWNFNGDSVIVTSASTTVIVQGVTYTGVTIYQRFSRTSDRSIKYYLKPVTVGIIKEEEFENSSLQLKRELIDTYIRN